MRHHAAVFMLKNVTVVDKVSDLGERYFDMNRSNHAPTVRLRPAPAQIFLTGKLSRTYAGSRRALLQQWKEII
jgi:hypothetical protein